MWNSKCAQKLREGSEISEVTNSVAQGPRYSVSRQTVLVNINNIDNQIDATITAY